MEAKSRFYPSAKRTFRHLTQDEYYFAYEALILFMKKLPLKKDWHNYCKIKQQMEKQQHMRGQLKLSLNQWKMLDAVVEKAKFNQTFLNPR